MRDTAPNHEAAISSLMKVGWDHESAREMVERHVGASTAKHGEREGGWRLDAHDLAEIERQYSWVDHLEGETLGSARERAVRKAREHAGAAVEFKSKTDPAYAAAQDRALKLWADRAHMDSMRLLDDAPPTSYESLMRARSAAADLERASRASNPHLAPSTRETREAVEAAREALGGRDDSGWWQEQGRTVDRSRGFERGM